MAKQMPEIALSSGQKSMPAVGLGSAVFPPVPTEVLQSAFVDAITEGYRHFDTSSVYGSESQLGVAIAEALRRGLVGKRDEFFITTKLWLTDAHAGSVVPALHESLRELQLDYVDLYLVHWPVSLKPSKVKSFPFMSEDVLLMDIKSVWEEMEECQKLGLGKSIGVSNFSCKKLDQILATAKIPPAVNQVEMHILWQQSKLANFCKEKGIVVSAYAPLGASGAAWGTKVMECRELKEIASERGKSLAQVCLRWVYEQGASIIVRTFNKERMKENLDIFDWKLSEEDLHKIEQLPQWKGFRGTEFLNVNCGFKSLEELWDGEI